MEGGPRRRHLLSSNLNIEYYVLISGKMSKIDVSQKMTKFNKDSKLLKENIASEMDISPTALKVSVSEVEETGVEPVDETLATKINSDDSGDSGDKTEKKESPIMLILGIVAGVIITITGIIGLLVCTKKTRCSILPETADGKKIAVANKQHFREMSFL
jgi:hypothetical protein